MKISEKINITLFKVIPKSLLSRIFGIITLIPLPGGLIKQIIRWYSKKFRVKDEYIVPQKGFKNFNHFFTRHLKEGARDIDTNTDTIISPVDARIDQFGEINFASIIQAKGIDYSLDELIPSKSAEKYIDGKFITLYLSPGDYHRIHSPVTGTITGYFTIPGTLYTVQEYMVKGLPGVFVKNERIITYIDTDRGPIAVCKVGAFNVGKISLSYEDIISNRNFRQRKEHFYPTVNQININKGDELGVFNLGSTIILLFQKDMINFADLERGNSIILGEKIASYI